MICLFNLHTSDWFAFLVL